MLLCSWILYLFELHSGWSVEVQNKGFLLCTGWPIFAWDNNETNMCNSSYVIKWMFCGVLQWPKRLAICWECLSLPWPRPSSNPRSKWAVIPSPRPKPRLRYLLDVFFQHVWGMRVVQFLLNYYPWPSIFRPTPPPLSLLRFSNFSLVLFVWGLFFNQSSFHHTWCLFLHQVHQGNSCPGISHIKSYVWGKGGGMGGGGVGCLFGCFF